MVIYVPVAFWSNLIELRKSESSLFDFVFEFRDKAVVVVAGFELVQYRVGLELLVGVEMILGFVADRLSMYWG